MAAEDTLISGFESERCRAFMRHWLALPKTGVLPHTRDFLDHAAPALIPNTMIEEVTPQGLLVRFMGTALVERWQRDITGHYMGENLPKDLYDRLVRHGRAVANHPCGLLQVGEVQSDSGRVVGFEAAVLPLAVDDGKPCRIVSFSHMLMTLGRQEHTDRFRRAGQRRWLDIGAGVPAEPPDND